MGIGHTFTHIDARMSNFVNRKLATMGVSNKSSLRPISSMTDIHYETLSMSKTSVSRKVA